MGFYLPLVVSQPPKRLSSHIPWVVAASQVFAVGITLCVSVQLLPCHERFLSHLWRAVQVSVSAKGTTFIGIIGTLLYPVIVSLRGGIRAFKESGWSSVRSLVRQRYTTAVSIAVAVWLILVIWDFIFMGPPSFSVAEIADFSQGIVVDIASNTSKQDAVGSGFWADSKGYMLTSSREPANRIIVGAMVPPLIGGTLITVAVGVMHTPGESVYRDPDTTVEVVRVYNNPFIRRLHQFAEAEDVKTHKKEHTIEKFWVPCLSTTAVSIGEVIFLAGVEPSAEGFAQVAIMEGRVTRIGVDTRAKNRFERIYTSLPFKPSYRGAPVLDGSKRVIGIVLDTNSSNSSSIILIPAKYLQDALTEAAPLMYQIQPTGPF